MFVLAAIFRGRLRKFDLCCVLRGQKNLNTELTEALGALRVSLKIRRTRRIVFGFRPDARAVPSQGCTIARS